MQIKRNVAVLSALFAAGLTLAALENTPVFAADPLPPLASPKPVKLPPVVERTLPNGLKIVLLEDHLQPSLSMRLAIPAGAIRDSADKIGVADATASLLDQGTATRDESQIADTVDGLGASLGASADSDYLSVSASGLASYADTLFDLLSDITLHPTFPADEWELHRTRTLSSITADLAEPSTVASAVLSRRVFGAHPYGNYETGTPETLAKITPADLKNFHDTYFVPNGSVLFLVGDITPDKAQELATKYFGSWEKKAVPALPAAPKAIVHPKNRVTIIDRPDSEQTEIRIGTLTGGYSDPDRTVANVANAVLGGGAFEGRLIKEIRVKRGLTYGANSSFARQKDAGIFTISTFTKSASTGEAVQVALDETRKLTTEGPGKDELGERKTYLTGSFAVGVATAQGVLARLVPAVLYGNGAADVSDFVTKVEAVTPESARDALKRSVPDSGLEIVLVGNAKAIGDQAKAFGDVNVIEGSDLDLNAPDLVKPKADTSAPFGDAASQEAGAKLFADTVAAHGGDAFVNIQSVKITGTGELATPASAGGLAIPLDGVVLTTASGGRTRLEAQSGIGNLVFVGQGTGKGAFLIFGGQLQNVPSDRFGQIEPTEVLRTAIRNKYPVRSVALDKPEKSDDGKDLSTFEVREPTGNVIRVYVEADTKRIRRVDTAVGGRQETVFLSGYGAPVNGVLLPKSLRLQQNGTDVVKLTVTKEEVNIPVDDSLFEKPKS